MEAHHAHAAFHLTGRLDADWLAPVDGRLLRPAQFAGLRDLTSLRYDYPLVLVEGSARGPVVQSLSGIVDALLDALQGQANEDRIRQHALRVESGIRSLLATGAQPLLSEAWETVGKELAANDDLMTDSLLHVRPAVDGLLVDCGRDTASQVVSHIWNAAYERRAQSFLTTSARLCLGLENILKADFQNSAAASSAANLERSFGSGPMDAFDFDAMSRILTSARPEKSLPDSRRVRVEHVLEVLTSQQFYPDGSAVGVDPYRFVFEHCSDALDAFRLRLPAAVEVAKALAIAGLEVSGEYDEAKHDQLFASFGEAGLDAADLAIFPDYLIVVNLGELSAAEQEQLSVVLSSSLPFSVLAQTDDILEPSAFGPTHTALALASHRLTSMAMGLGDVFVLQSPTSHLLRVVDQVARGLEHEGPALFSVFSGVGADAPGTPPYLVAAAALEARVFPLFVYDPSAGPDWASRFALDGNPSVSDDFPVHAFAYEGVDGQSVQADLPFTLVDFVSCDRRSGRHFAEAPRSTWGGHLVAADVLVSALEHVGADEVPCILMVDDEDLVRRIVVDEHVIREARRCRSMWRSLQELAGIHNSHVERRLAESDARWQERLAQQSAEVTSAVPVAIANAEAPTLEVVIAEDVVGDQPAATRDPDEPFIETMRCSTCNECTQINNRMFAYNENQQAYIADITAGTYAQLVEAAESCQVSVIHPGKPRDPNEPGLPDLLKRAELFA